MQDKPRTSEFLPFACDVAKLCCLAPLLVTLQKGRERFSTCWVGRLIRNVEDVDVDEDVKKGETSKEKPLSRA